MKYWKTGLLLALLAAATSTSGFSQAAPQQDAERLRVELAERARREAEERDWETKIFQIKFVDPNELRAALSMFRSNISYAGGGLRVLAIRAPKEIMPAIEDAIKRLDVPSPRREAELTIFILLAGDQVDSANPVPSSLQPVVNQLKGVLSYKGYQLVDTLITRATDTRGTPAILKGTVMMGSQQANYNFSARFRVENRDGKTSTLQLSDMNFRFQPAGLAELTVAADVDVPQGQQVVVGKATMGDKAIILVMTSKFPN